ncbi:MULTISPECIES: HD-GYP domain-containing protein [unclassified Rhodanobacter]|uniref:HD-GYP domain-containing protein n=1 Tax=unclassified Rhodanobacter TaxID=2621553 RepID=UPI000A5EA1A8|nr:MULTISPECIES: HD-GYP domain-containing protein [unclassified Rhodanobacter]
METWLSRIEPVLHETLGHRDAHTAVHCARVGMLALALARVFGLSGSDLLILGTAARLHDIGKIGIPDAILRKPGPLDAAEWAIMQSHSERGERIVRADPGLPWRDDIALVIRHHHEHYDGSGYPDGLRGQAIPLLSRLLSVADSYDAMTEPRAYRLERSHREAMTTLRDESGGKHDPQMVDLILSRDETWFMQFGESRG